MKGQLLVPHLRHGHLLGHGLVIKQDLQGAVGAEDGLVQVVDNDLAAAERVILPRAQKLDVFTVFEEEASLVFVDDNFLHDM